MNFFWFHLLEKVAFWSLWTSINIQQTGAVAIGGLVGFWPLNSTYGTSDVSGNGNHGVVSGDVNLVRGINNERGGAYRFLGKSVMDFIRIPNNGALDTRHNMTILLWYRREGSNKGPIVNYDHPTYYHGGVHLWDLTYGSSARPYVQFQSRFNATIKTSFSTSTDRNWQHMAVTYNQNAGIGRLYINGTERGRRNDMGFELATGYDIFMGNRQRQSDGRRLSGKVTCLQIYDVELSVQEIKVAMSQCMQGTQSGIWSKVHMGKRLTGHVEALEHTQSRTQCVIACEATATCHSINFSPIPGSGEALCELNSKNEDDSAAAMADAEGTEYWDRD